MGQSRAGLRLEPVGASSATGGEKPVSRSRRHGHVWQVVSASPRRQGVSRQIYFSRTVSQKGGRTYSLAAERLARLGMDELEAGDCDAGKTMLLGRRLARGLKTTSARACRGESQFAASQPSALPLIKKSERGREASQRATARSVLIEAQRTEKTSVGPLDAVARCRHAGGRKLKEGR
jgi:5-methylcytosine-specific restriction endonuclease McrA